MVPPLTHTLLIFAGMMPLVLTDIWRVATMPLPTPNRVDALCTVGTTFMTPVAVYVLFRVAVGRILGDTSLAVLFLVAATIFFFLALLRSLMWARHWFRANAFQQHPWGAPLVTALVAIVLPVGGLLLNRAIPFPADFQFPAVYVLTILNALVLLMPRSATPGSAEHQLGQPNDASTTPVSVAELVLGAPRFFLRWATFPFTLYFFLIFIPFFPLAIPAIIAVGTGFLILAPVFLFWRHVTVLAQDWRNTALPRMRKVILAILAVSVMPGAILTNAWLDRIAFHKILDYAFSPDITRDAQLPASPARIRRVLKRAEAFKNSNETPILSAVYTQIVFDGLVLPDERFNFMWDCYVAEERNEDTADSWRNEFGSLFSRNQARGRRGWGGTRTSPPRNAVLEAGDVNVAVSTNGYEQTVTLRLRIATTNDQQQEFHAPITLPPATWITGMRLKIDNEWQDASIIERRAAEWVYKQITSQRRDPAILTLDTPERGLLRVFPVTKDLPRDLEITFLQPAGMHGKIEVGGIDYWLEETEEFLQKLLQKPFCAGNTVFVPNQSGSSSFRLHQTHSFSGETILLLPLPYPEMIVIDSSAKGGSLEKVQELLKEAQDYRHAPNLKPNIVLSANAETKTSVLSPSETPTYPRVDASMLLPNQFGLDAARALRQVDYHIRNTDASSHIDAPIFFIGDQWEELLAKTPPCDYTSRYYPIIFTTDGRIIAADKSLVARGEPFSMEGSGFPRLYPKDCTPTYPDHLLFSQGAALWKLQQDCYDHGTLNKNYRRILSESSRTGILVPQTAYIVVETEAQRKMLAVKQAEAANANLALDFDYDAVKQTVDAPSLLILALAFAAFVLLRKCRERRAPWERRAPARPT